MRLIFIFLGLAATSAFAHKPNSHDAKPPEPSRKTMRTQANSPVQADAAGNSGLRHSDKAHSDEQRFCVKNSIGKVNCIVLPGGGH